MNHLSWRALATPPAEELMIIFRVDLRGFEGADSRGSPFRGVSLARIMIRRQNDLIPAVARG